MFAPGIRSAFSRLSIGGKIAACVALVALVFAVDCLTGKEISFSIFYLLPIMLVAATAGWNGAVLVSAISGVAWYSADYLGGTLYSQAWIPVWNTVMRVMIFMLVARLLISFIATRDKANRAEAAAQRAAQAKSDFLSNMSHEIRTPLNAMLGVAQLLDETELNAHQREFIKIFRNEGEQLRRLINDVLDLSKFEAGKFQLEIKPFHLGQMAQALAQTFTPAASEKGLHLEAVIAPAADRAWLGDAHRLRQVLANLLGNAIKFTESGRIILRIEEALPRADPPLLQFSVEDTGVGVDPQLQNQLFQRYEQLENRAANLAAGTGLGLSISRALVETMGGSLQLKSEPNRGSTFYFGIPLTPATEASPTPATARDDGKHGEVLPGKSVLLVEDYKTNQLIFEEYLRTAGCRVTLATNGREGVERFMNDVFDVVIMDMQMPVLDGWSATREIRAWEKGQKRLATPILALTASALKEDQERCHEAGCTLFLAKPVLKAELLTTIASLFGGEKKAAASATRAIGLEGLLPMFFADTRKALSDIQQARAEQDWVQIGRSAHQLTGSGTTFGYPEITALGREIEAAATDRNEMRCRELADALAKLLSTLPPT